MTYCTVCGAGYKTDSDHCAQCAGWPRLVSEAEWGESEPRYAQPLFRTPVPPTLQAQLMPGEDVLGAFETARGNTGRCALVLTASRVIVFEHRMQRVTSVFWRAIASVACTPSRGHVTVTITAPNLALDITGVSHDDALFLVQTATSIATGRLQSA